MIRKFLGWGFRLAVFVGALMAIGLTLASCKLGPPQVPVNTLPLPIVRDCAPGFVAAPERVWTAPVSAVIDGDSFCLAQPGGDVEIRIARYNAPEWDEPGGDAARARTGEILRLGSPLTCTSRARSYDRVIADCQLADGRDLADVLKGEAP